ncbi:glycosyltransferase [Alicyclobacillus tolerans]|uniref:glycosyltransferase n=1 Tax=Alicyclobacillus tolerans TaxID=90970 RepID=UPI003B7AC871
MDLSIVVPTYNERENVVIVAEAIRNCTLDYNIEVIFVDDSTDISSIDTLNKLKLNYNWVRVEHRENERGLGSAVVKGFELAQGQYIAVMDADMQHPPEILVNMLKRIKIGEYDIVIPSRFIPGGNDGGLSGFRKIVSWTARIIAQLLLKRVRKVTDPTSGFFLFRRTVIDGVKLHPIGWKILIEILVRGNYKSVLEIPYHFKPRINGQSNMSLKVQWKYICHLALLLRDSPEDRRFYLFCLVGASGVILNQIIYISLLHLKLNVIVSSIIAAGLVLISNFLLNDRFTWNDSLASHKAKRFLRFAAISLIGIAINEAVLASLVYFLGVHYILGNLTGIAIATLWNFIINHKVTWQMNRSINGHFKEQTYEKIQ